MNQSAIIGGSLLAGFVLFLAARNRLSAYAGVLWGGKPATHSTPVSKSPTAGVIPGAPDFDPLDVMGDWGLGVGDLFNMDWGAMLPDMGAGE